jgi:hypothetical protein
MPISQYILGVHFNESFPKNFVKKGSLRGHCTIGIMDTIDLGQA